MNARIQSEAGESDQRHADAIIQRCALDHEAIAEINHLRSTAMIRFGDAAVRLGHATQADIDRAAGSTQIATIRDRFAVPQQCLVVAHQPFHPRCEKIRMLRTELMLRHEDSDTANLVTILSPCAGEGRSQVAAELAIAFSQLGRPTLLVDADLRHPQQHILFNADNRRGLAQALARQQPPLFQIVSGLPALHLLTSGPLPGNPLELLSDRAFEAMVSEWRQNFDFVVLDTPPAGLYADGLAVATIVGRVLSLSHARHTPYKDTRDMLRRLAATQSRILGAVLNDF